LKGAQADWLVFYRVIYKNEALEEDDDTEEDKTIE
jgi:hypothetical protein